MTEWIVACHCLDSARASLTADERIDLCATCGKRIPSGRAGSFTQWVFRSDTCKCDVPIHMRPRMEESTQSQSPEDNHEEEEELSIDGEPFPLDRYKPLAELGAGVTGRVYMCRDRLLGKRVAIKCLRVINSEQLIAFQREAKATSLLQHPSIVPVLDFGATTAGAPYMVLDFVQGITLAKYMSENGPPDFPKSLSIAVSLAEALEYAHDKGVFHRDVQPANVLLQNAEGEFPDVRVIDFGIAAFSDTSKQSDTIAGTPMYMSPDQANGLKYDRRSEIYSLGCVLFELLTGSPPFAGDTALETISMHAREPVPTLAEANPELSYSAELETIVADCLAKNPEERFSSMKELAAELKEELSRIHVPEDVEIKAVSQSQRFKPAAIIFVLAILGVAVFWSPIVDSGKTIFKINRNEESMRISQEAWNELTNDNVDKALELAGRALEIDKDNLSALDTRGLAYFLKGDTKSALADFNAVIRRAPKQKFNASIAVFHHALVNRTLGDESDYEKYLEQGSKTRYLPTQWEQRKFDRWVTTDWHLTPVERGEGESVSFLGIGNVNYGTTDVRFSMLSTDSDMKGLEQHPELTRVDIVNADVTAVGLSNLRFLPLLECANFFGLRIKDDDLSVLKNCPKLNQIVIMHISQLDGSCFKFFKPDQLTNQIFLSDLRGFSRDNLSYLARQSKVEDLNVAGVPALSNADLGVVYGAGMKSIAWTPRLRDHVSGHTAKQELEPLSGVDLTYYEVDSMRRLVADGTVNSLWLDSDAMKPEIWDALAASESLVLISLQGQNKLNPTDLAKLHKCKRLSTLYIGGEILDRESAQVISQFPHLRSLVVGHAELDGELVRATENPRMVSYAFFCTRASQDVLQALSELKRLETITIAETDSSMTPAQQAQFQAMLGKDVKFTYSGFSRGER